MTEVYLEPADRGTTILLDNLAALGTELRLTEPVVEEVWHNLKNANRQFELDFSNIYQYVSWDVAREVKKILIRSFLYALLEARSRGERIYWSNFVDKFCQHRSLDSAEGKRQLQDYFESRFKMKFVSRERLEKSVNDNLFEDVKNRIAPAKDDEHLAENDALIIAHIYGSRENNRDRSAKKFGYLRWWLTQETKIIALVGDLIPRYGEFALRPEFLFYYIDFNWKRSDKKDNFEKMVMGSMGVSLSNRIASNVVQDALDKYRRIEQMEEARKESELAALTRRVQQEHKRFLGARSRTEQ